MLYSNTKDKVRLPDGDIFAVLQQLASYLSIICLDNVLRTSIELMKEEGLKGKKQTIQMP